MVVFELKSGRPQLRRPALLRWEPYLLVAVDTPVTWSPLPDLTAMTVVVGTSGMAWSPLEATPGAAMVVGIAPVIWSPLPQIACSRADCRGGKHGD